MPRSKQPEGREEFERRSLDAIRPRPENEKTHTPAQIDKLVESIRTFGFNDPVEIDEYGFILAGEGRWRAAKQLGLADVPVIVHEGLTPAQKRAYAVAHNQLTLSTGLDMDMVSAEFERLGIGSDEYAALGFTEDEVIFMMPEQRTIMDDDGIASPTMDVDTWADFIPKVIRSKIVFDNQTQQARFEQFLQKLREVYPTEATNADRLMRFVADHAALDLPL